MARPNLRPFPFLALPTELRLQIHNYLLPSAPTTYDCTNTYPPRRRRYPLRRHGMLLANRQLHAEYAQAFYERTSFFFYVDEDNGMQPATTPFWTLPPALLPNLRTFRLFIELEQLVRVEDFSIGALVARIEALLGCMERVQGLQLEWDYGTTTGRPVWEWEEGELLGWEGLWKRLGEPFVQRLKGRAGMQWMVVIIHGLNIGSHTHFLEREGAEWVKRGWAPY